jgi:hypothetical protein
VLAALAHDPQRPVTTVEVQVADVSTQGFADPQPVQR